VIIAKGREITTIVINVIQQLVVRANNHLALIIVEDKAKVLEMEAIFENSKGILIWCTGT
jgi:hypothetical protein